MGANGRMMACTTMEERTRELASIDQNIIEAAPMHSRSAAANEELDKAITRANTVKVEAEARIRRVAVEAHLK